MDTVCFENLHGHPKHIFPHPSLLEQQGLCFAYLSDITIGWTDFQVTHAYNGSVTHTLANQLGEAEVGCTP